MKIYKESKDVPVAVGQVWQERGCEDNLTVIGLKGDEFAGEYTSGDHGFTASHTCKLVDLIKLESGAEMDFDAYEYMFSHGVEFPDDTPTCYWEVYNTYRKEWKTNSFVPLISKHLYRRAKETTLPPLPEDTPKRKSYVDREVYVDEEGDICVRQEDDSFLFFLNDSFEDPDFIGFIYGDEVSMSARRHGGKDCRATIPTHVRFAEVSK